MSMGSMTPSLWKGGAGLAIGASCDLNHHFAQALIPDDLAANKERVARSEGGGEGFFDFTQWLAAALALHPNLDQIGVLDRADVHPDEPRGSGIA